MISGFHELVFLHVPKCAGISIEAALGGVSVERSHEQHWSSAMIRRYYPEEWEAFHHFAVVRHPADRARSYVRFLRRYDPVWRRHLRGTSETTLLLDLICSEGPFAQTSAAGLLSGREEILRFETLADDWGGFAARHGLPRVLPERNRGTGPVPRVDDDRLIDHVVAAAFPDDYRRFGYPLPEEPEAALPLAWQGTVRWVALHAWARDVPHHPEEADVARALATLDAWAAALPKPEWRDRWERARTLRPPDLKDGRAARRWVTRIRDDINVDLGKPTWDAWAP